MTRWMMIRSLSLLVLIGISATVRVRGEDAVSSPQNASEKRDSEFASLFDGTTLERWQGDEKWFRVEELAIVGGSLKERIPHNFFLSSEATYGDFELTLEFRLKGDQTNAGIQLRSQRIPGHHEMIGYQADLGQSYWGCLYDESRRNRVLAAPDPQKIAATLKKEDWNSYRILCEGTRIQLWINDLQTVDYTETESGIPQTGHIALQIHGGPPGEAWYRNVRLRQLSARTE